MHQAIRGSNISRSNPTPIARTIDSNRALPTDLGPEVDGQAHHSLWNPNIRYTAPIPSFLFKSGKHYQGIEKPNECNQAHTYTMTDPESSGSTRGSTRTQRIIHKVKDMTKPASKLMLPRGLRYPVIQPATTHPLSPPASSHLGDLGLRTYSARETLEEQPIWSHLSDDQRVRTVEKAAAAKIYLETYYREAMSNVLTKGEQPIAGFQCQLGEQAYYLEPCQVESSRGGVFAQETNHLRERRVAKTQSCRVA